jgi:hypothetical protein
MTLSMPAFRTASTLPPTAIIRRWHTARARRPTSLTDVILSRRPMSDYDQLVADWRTSAGDRVRTEYTDAIAAAKG